MLSLWGETIYIFFFLTKIDVIISLQLNFCTFHAFLEFALENESCLNPISHGIFDPAVPRGGGGDSTPPLENTLGGV